MDTFWVSFWSALYSGVIYSIITGIIVGLVIWWVQSKVERKKEIKKYEIDVSVFKSKLKMIINRPDTITVDNLCSLQPSVTETVNFLKEYPITVWEHNLVSERDLMSLLKNLQNDYLKALSNAHNLDDNLKNFIREYNSKNGHHAPLNDQAPYVFFVGKLFEKENKKIIPWLGMPVNSIPEWVEECYQNADKDETITEQAKSYMDTRKELDNDMANIKNILDKN
jgi:hypothetical protein